MTNYPWCFATGTRFTHAARFTYAAQRTHLTRPTRRRQQGFTLIEILVVMAIIAMLAIMVAPNIFNQQAGA
ncbi:MAG: type II secretion system GspH family protein, partial [OM182 bacterium]|nr:type II secretion system GspH family protein [OM182 bacterium]